MIKRSGYHPIGVDSGIGKLHLEHSRFMHIHKKVSQIVGGTGYTSVRGASWEDTFKLQREPDHRIRLGVSVRVFGVLFTLQKIRAVSPQKG